ncbi:hypothetical protein BGV60_27475 [Burkholderia ubonensis]|nr:hypothetical protein WJ88_14630 [Burkholderia ubonensis]KVU64874.1 hypothetical protein WK71_01585 [Burkholderia ubonensis]OJB46972.1 hypothetical protein BGV59_23485 [Burkholderia ubonensis]OJB47125.1 hypothetical protein BGV60_27475 [Burkholderia ubonensis]
MHEIICPHCGKAFKIDESGYADILKQVRDSEFEKQLHERLELAEEDKRNAVELAQTAAKAVLGKATQNCRLGSASDVRGILRSASCTQIFRT